MTVVTLNSTAPHKRLTSLETLKSELELSTSVQYDDVLYEIINQASDFIHQYTEREFAQETVTETISSRGGPIIMVARTPIQSISFIELDGSSVSSTAYEIEDKDAGLIWKEDGFDHTMIIDSFANEYPTRYGRKDWTVKYTGGYILPDSTGTRTLPYEIERACLDISKTWFLNRKTDPNIKVQKLGEALETRFDLLQTGGIPPNTLHILNRWKRYDLNRIR